MWVFINLLLALAALGQTPQGAQALEAKGDWTAAETVWTTLVHQHPDDYRYWTSLGACRAHQNKFTQAIAAYKKALSLNRNAAETQFNLGIAYFKSGNLEKAIGPLQTAAPHLPGNRQIDVVLGMALYGLGRYKDAAPYLEAAQANDPQNKELQFVLAQAYLWGGEYDKAKRQFQAMLLSDPNSAQAHMLLGEAYDGLGKTGEAIAEFREATQGPAIPGAHFGLGYLLWKNHDYAAAIPEFQKEVSSDPDNYQCFGYRGDAELKLGQTEAAERDLKKSIAIAPKLWLAEFDLGKIEQDKQQYAAAAQHFKQAAQEDSERAEPHYHLAQVYKAMGQEEEARAQLAIVSRLNQHKTDDLVLKISGTNRPGR